MAASRQRVLVIGAVLLLGGAACGASPSVARQVAARDSASSAGGLAPGLQTGSTSAPASGTTGGASNAAPAASSSGSVAAPSANAATSGAPSAATAGGSSSGAVSSGASTSPAAPAPSGGNGGPTDVGVSATSIKIGGTFFNGSYLDQFSQVAEQSAKAYFQYVNDSGGIYGRTIDYQTCDTSATATGTQGCLKNFGDQAKVFIMGPSLDFNLDTVQPYLAQHQLPWVGTSGLYGAEFQSPWMFPTQLRGTDVGALIATYAGQTLHVKTVGVSYLNEVAGPECTQRVKDVAAKAGFQVVVTASNAEIETGLDSQVSQIQAAHPDAVLFCNDPINTIKFIQAAQRKAYKATWVGGFVAADVVPQAAGSYASGMYGFTGYDFYNLNTPGLQQYRQITSYYYPNIFHHFYEQATYVGAEAIVAAIRKAGPNLTRQSFLAALRSFTDYDTGMGLHINFANIASSQTSSGMMLQADNSLKWHVVSGRFSALA
jgi:branched-chain amino acid transport system substrate-binding protein